MELARVRGYGGAAAFVATENNKTRRVSVVRELVDGPPYLPNSLSGEPSVDVVAMRRKPVMVRVRKSMAVETGGRILRKKMECRNGFKVRTPAPRRVKIR